MSNTQLCDQYITNKCSPPPPPVGPVGRKGHIIVVLGLILGILQTQQNIINDSFNKYNDMIIMVCFIECIMQYICLLFVSLK